MIKKTVRHYLDMVSEKIVRSDRMALKRAATRGSYYNPNAMGLQLERLQKIETELGHMMNSDSAIDLRVLRSALERGFAHDFSPSRATIKAIDAELARRTE